MKFNTFPAPLQEFLHRLKQRGQQPIVLMWGLGCDTGKILLDWLTDPTTRDFELDQLVVIVSMTLGEWSKTGYQNEMYLLPLLAKHSVLTVQIVKAGPTKAEGYTILDCSTQPRKLWLYGWATPPLSPMSQGIPFDPSPIASPLHPLWTPEGRWLMPGAWRINHPNGIEASYSQFPDDPPHLYLTEAAGNQYGLADECFDGGTIPQYSGGHKCSIKFKVEQGTSVQDGIGRVMGLGDLMFENGSIPQYSGKVRSCSDRGKQEGLNEGISTFFGNPINNRAYGLGEDLMLGGAVPQTSKGKGKGKCSNKAKTVPCDGVTDGFSDELGLEYEWKPVEKIKNRSRKLLFHRDDPGLSVPLPPFVTIVIGFNADETSRIQRGEESERERALENLKRLQPVRPAVYKLYRYPLKERGITRTMLEQSLFEAFLEWFWRSACNFCPFSAINGGSKEFLIKHRHLPDESGYALLMEFIARRLNSKQVLTPTGSLFDLLTKHGVTTAIDNLEARVRALPWAVYRVQRLYTTKAPMRRTQILATGSFDEIHDLLLEQSAALGVHATQDPDRIWRAWIENKPQVLDFLVACPKVPIEKNRTGWHDNWQAAHEQQLSLGISAPSKTPTTRKPTSHAPAKNPQLECSAAPESPASSQPANGQYELAKQSRRKRVEGNGTSVQLPIV